jgi:FMN phosphatase YigB (HAD superfamily)
MANLPLNILPRDDVTDDDIDMELGTSYLRCWRAQALKLRADLVVKKSAIWISFRDILHITPEGNRAAVKASLALIPVKYPRRYPDLWKTYNYVVSGWPLDAMFDQRSDHENQTQKYVSLMLYLALPSDEMFAGYLASMQENNLLQCVSLKPGVAELIRLLKQMGKHIFVVSNGDAITTTWSILRNLGVGGMIDFVGSRATEADDWPVQLLANFKLKPADVMYVGSNKDLVPVRRAGLSTIHLTEHLCFNLDASTPVVTTFRKLYLIMGGPDANGISLE